MALEYTGDSCEHQMDYCERKIRSVDEFTGYHIAARVRSETKEGFSDKSRAYIVLAALW